MKSSSGYLTKAVALFLEDATMRDTTRNELKQITTLSLNDFKNSLVSTSESKVIQALRIQSKTFT